jgi:hypothetical protein
MLPLPQPAARVTRGWAEASIDPGHLYGDGIEEWPHITLKYGFVNEPGLLGRIRTLLSEIPPPRAEVAGLSHFPDSSDGDVLKLNVTGDDLHSLYHDLSAQFKCVDKWHPHYRPHVTLAYLRPGKARKYLKLDPPEELKIVFPRAVYSDAFGVKSEVSFGPMKKYGKTMSGIDVTAGGALIPPPAFAPRLEDLTKIRYRARRSMLAPAVKSWVRRGNWSK